MGLLLIQLMQKIYEVAEKYNINIILILNTHKHDDHVCGNIRLQELVAAAKNNNNTFLERRQFMVQMMLVQRQDVQI